MLIEKNKYLPSTTSQQRLNHLMVLHVYVNLAKDMDLIQVTINMVSKKSEKKEVLWPICVKFKLDIVDIQVCLCW